MNIVCGTDFSPYAKEAAGVAAVLAVRLKGKVMLAHVFEATRYELPTKADYDALREKHRERLKIEAQQLRRTGAVVDESLLEGSPAIELSDLAKRTQAGLVVVSTLGQIAPSRWFVGSVAERTVQMAPAPTLVVRRDRAFKAWASRERPLRILVGFDLAGGSEAALCWATSLLKFGPCKITVASIVSPNEERWRLGIEGNRSGPEDPPELQKLLERDLRRRCEELVDAGSVQIRIAAARERTDLQLIELARSERADLVVVGTSQRHGLERFWLGSVSRGIVYHAPMTVACVPNSVAPEVPGGIPVFKRALVATDFSKVANAAIPFAFSTLYRGGSVCVFHVATPDGSGANTRRKRLKKLENELQALIPSEAKARWITTTVEVVENSDPSTAICQAAERVGADLICLGSRGRSGLSKAILGSVAQKVTTRSNRPVLIVP